MSTKKQRDTLIAYGVISIPTLVLCGVMYYGVAQDERELKHIIRQSSVYLQKQEQEAKEAEAYYQQLKERLHVDSVR